MKCAKQTSPALGSGLALARRSSCGSVQTGRVRQFDFTEIRAAIPHNALVGSAVFSGVFEKPYLWGFSPKCCQTYGFLSDCNREEKSRGSVSGYAIACAEPEPEPPLSRALASLLPINHPPIIGVDAEWTEECEGRNRVLSYQYCIITPSGSASGIIEVEGGKRITLRKLVETAVEEALARRLLPSFPREVYLAAHFTRADLSHFSDFRLRLGEIDAVRKTFATTTRPINLICYSYYTLANGKKHSHRRYKVRATIRDTSLLAPAKTPLDRLGETLGFPKLDLPPGYSKGRMDIFQRERPDEFRAYAIRDAEIVALYLRTVVDLVWNTQGPKRGKRGEVITPKIPPTLSSFGVDFLLRGWRRAGIDADAVMGRKREKRQTWDSGRNRPRTSQVRVETSGYATWKELARQCYSGGRNECYIFGFTERDVWSDFDLSGAYATAMAALRMPDYDRAYECLDPAAYRADVLGVAKVEFEFPPSARFPSMPIRAGEKGLIFPRRGVAFVGAPEIATAMSHGASITIRRGVIVPWAEGSARPFEEFTRETQRRRKAAVKGSVDELAWKEIGNSLYGKLAQGLSGKRGYNSRTRRSEPIEGSKITNPFLAAYTTSLVRAVLAEHLHAIPRQRCVVSATTDGFLTNATLGEIAKTGPATEVFRDVRERLFRSSDVLELKHQDAQILAWRTRGQVSAEPIEGHKSVMARGSIQLRGDDQRGQLIRKFLDRKHGDTIKIRHFVSLRKMVERHVDLTMETEEKRLKMEFDFKRKPDEASVCERGGSLYFDTEPWETVEEFLAYREAFDRWCEAGNTLKTLADWRRWKDYLAGAALSRQGVRRTKGGTQDQARRVFLRAAAHGEWGLQREPYRDVADKLTAAGFPTSINDLKKARLKGPPPAHAVPRAAEGMSEFIDTVSELWPAFDSARMFNVGVGAAAAVG